MPLDDDTEAQLGRFAAHARIAATGTVITDLDGTAVHEDAGRIVIPPGVESGLRRVRALGRPVILNSLRFPLSIMRSFGQEWYAISAAPLRTVALNGSLVGWLTRSDSGALAFDEIEAFPLDAGEIEATLERIDALLSAGLQAEWAGQDVCMALLLLDLPQERLMAYQHTERERFVTHAGVDKRHGARRIADRLQVALEDSVGAGDTAMDTFLDEVGLAITVGGAAPPFRGRLGTVRVDDSLHLGRLLHRLAELHAQARA